MAQRKNRAAARRGKAATRSKARMRTKPARGKRAKSANAKAAPGKRATKAKSKRAVAKKAVPTKARRPKPPSTRSVETVIVDMIKEPVPGVVVITEFEATGIPGANAIPEQREESRGAAPPESEERVSAPPSHAS
jgi:hypothetical protein